MRYFIVFYKGFGEKIRKNGHIDIISHNSAYLNRKNTLELITEIHPELKIVLTGFKELTKQEYDEWIAE